MTPENSAVPDTSRWHVLLLLCVVGGIIYAPILNADFGSDEICLISWTEYAGPVDYLYRFLPFKGEMMYRPLLVMIWSLYYWLGGGSAALFHIELVAAHLLTAWLLWLIAFRLSRSTALSTVAALLFISTPLSVETVAWILGIDDVYGMLFFLASLLFFIKADDRPASRRTALSLSLLFGLLSLLTRESAVTLPFVILMCDCIVIRVRKGKPVVAYLRERWALYACYFLLVFIFFGFRSRMLGGLRGYGAGGITYVPPLAEIARDAFLKMPSILVCPLKHSTVLKLIPAAAVPWVEQPSFLVGAFLMLSALAVSVRRVRWEIVLFGFGWCFAAILAHWQVLHSIGLIDQDLEFSHYLYQPAAGFCLAVSAVLVCGQRGWKRALATCVTGALLVSYIVVSISYCTVFRRSFHVAQTILRQFKEMRLPLPQGSRVFMMDVPTDIEGARVWWGGTSITVWCDPAPSMGPVLERGLWHYSVEPAVRQRYPYRIFMVNRDVGLEERRNEYEAAPRFSLDYLRTLTPGETDYFLRWLPGEERLADITGLVRERMSKAPPPNPVSWTAGEIVRGGQWAPFGDARLGKDADGGAVRLSIGPRGGGLRLEGAPFSPDERANLELEAALLSPGMVEAALEYRTEEEDRYDADKRVAFVLNAAPGFAAVRVPLTRRIYDLIDGRITGVRLAFPRGKPVEVEIRSIRLR